MEIIKKSNLFIAALICILISNFSCREKSVIKNETLEKYSLLIDTIGINNDLLQSSKDFINRNNIINGNIEVDIDKKEYNQTYVTFITRGIADFAVRKFKPLFTYQIKSNIFFVFTGAEELLTIPFDESKFINRRQAKYDTIIKAWYVFDDNIMRRHDSCTLYEPFSNLQPSLPPPLPKH